MRAIVYSVSLLVLASSVQAREYEASKVQNVHIESLAGDVKIVGVKKQKSTIDVNKRKFGEHCKLDTSLSDGTLHVMLERDENETKKQCSANFILEVPVTANIEVKLGAGDISIKDTQGAVEFTIGEGSAKVTGDPTSVEGTTGKGDIRVEADTARGEFRTGKGDIVLQYQKVPNDGQLIAETGTGDVKIVIPKTSKYKKSVKMGSGNVVDKVGETQKSSFEFRVKTGTGDLEIKEG